MKAELVLQIENTKLNIYHEALVANGLPALADNTAQYSNADV